MVNHKKAKRLVAEYQEIFGLLDWDVRYSETPAEEEHYATLDWRDQEKVAQIRLTHEDDHDLEASIVHEMLHLVLKTYSVPMLRLVSLMDEPLRTFLAGQLEDAEEQVIETIVRSYGFERFKPIDELKAMWPAFS
jgi:hypothetical protein